VSVGWLLARPVPASVGKPPEELDARAVQFPSESGAEIKAWWCPADDASATIILLPGIRANRLSMLRRARFLHRARYSILLIDFQSTGETEGTGITFGQKESRDVLAAVGFVRHKMPGTTIGIIGSSLGGAATLLASPPLHIDAAVLEAVYPTIESATHNRLTKYLGSPGVFAAPLLLGVMRWQLGISPGQMRPVDHIASATYPVLILNGANDRNTTSDDARRLFGAARAQKELWIVPGAGHVDLHRAATAEYETRVLAFFASTLKRASMSESNQ
jgi:dipeptidyl aminopeptidase/acylaminoacyl peptidase